MDMDNTTESHQKLGMAKALYSGLCGVEPDAESKTQAVSFSKHFFDSPWRDESDATSRAYARRFFDELPKLAKATGLLDRWKHCFDGDYNPLSTDGAHAFITDFMRAHLHYPRKYHDFVCQRLDVHVASVMDFKIAHPIAVEFWAIYITIEGDGLMSSGGTSTVLRPGSVLIVPPGASGVLSRQDTAESWHYHWLSFRSRLEWTELLEWVSALTHPFYFHVDEPGKYQPLLDQAGQLETITYMPGTLSERLCNNIIEHILIRLRMLADQGTSAGLRVDRRARVAVDYILNNYSEDISVEMIARAVNISPSRLSALFRQHFGVSLIKWRDHIRMEKAKELINNTSSLIGDIANQVGYADPLYFSRRFNDHFGCSPTKIRSSRH